jgi:alanine-glyoxylate transaminase / serine-glyoxylate transaminase / serine-pyruvate transaminase
VLLPEGHDEARFRTLTLDGWDLSLGAGLGKLQGRVFRIGHLGDLNDLMLLGTLCGVELGLRAAGIPHADGGVRAALERLAVPLAMPAPLRVSA